MLSKVFTSLTLVLALSLEAHAHAAVAPALGVAGTPARSDVQRPSNAKPCGKANIAQTLDTSTPVAAAADGTFTATVTNFNAGTDGSRQMTATVDATGAGKNFVAATISQNGDAKPASTGSQQLVVSLPAGTKCTGGTSGNLCLASFKSLGGFGNCVVVQQGAAAATGAGNATATDAATNGTAAAGAATNGTAATGAATNGTAATGTAAAGTAAAAGAAAAGNAATNGKGRGKAAGNAAGAGAAAKTAKGNAAAGNAAGAGAGAAAGNAATGAGAGAKGAAGNAAGAGAAGAGAGAGAAGNAAVAQTGNGKAQGAGRFGNAGQGNAAAAGSRAPRALLADLETRGEDAVKMMKRNVLSWMWA